MFKELLSVFRTSDPLRAMEKNFSAMLIIGYEMVISAGEMFFAGNSTPEERTELYRRDVRVNKLQRYIRKQVVAHLSVSGSRPDVPYSLLLVSLVKDVERIGDYAKNIYDVAAQGVDLSDAPDRAVLIEYRRRISSMISEASTIFADDDRAKAAAFISEADVLLDEFDAHVSDLVITDQSGQEAVPRALLYRYYKRIVAHLMNLLSAVVMPLDRLDYFDEERVRP